MIPRVMARMGLPFAEIWKSAERVALGMKIKSSALDTKFKVHK